MTRLRLDQLPPALRRRVETEAGKQGVKRRRRAELPASAGGHPYRCVRCSRVETTWELMEKHLDETGHVRAEAVLG